MTEIWRGFLIVVLCPEPLTHRTFSAGCAGVTAIFFRHVPYPQQLRLFPGVQNEVRTDQGWSAIHYGIIVQGADRAYAQYILSGAKVVVVRSTVAE